MVAEPFRKRWTGQEPVGFDSSALCNKPGCSWESSQSPKLAHSVRITAPAPDRVSAGKVRCARLRTERAGGVRCARLRNRGRGGREATALLTRQASRNGATGFDSQAL